MGGHSGDDKAVAGTALLLQAILSKWHFHSVPGAHTTPGSMHLSTGTENESLVHYASKETDQEKPINQAACPQEGHPRAADQECLSLVQHPNRVPNLQPLLPTPPWEDASTGNTKVYLGGKHLNPSPAGSP